jgi:hypothetical protein
MHASLAAGGLAFPDVADGAVALAWAAFDGCGLTHARMFEASLAGSEPWVGQGMDGSYSNRWVGRGPRIPRIPNLARVSCAQH